jgi:predicted nuclease with TOPRIM domain
MLVETENYLTAMAEQNGWNEYSKLVLKELESLNNKVENLSVEIQGIKKEVAIIKDREDRVEELKVWKDRVSEVVSPAQLKEAMTTLHELREFKTKAITIFIVVQTLMGIAFSVINYLK